MNEDPVRLSARIDRAIDELLEEGYLVPTIGADGNTVITLSTKYHQDRCQEELVVEEPHHFGTPHHGRWVLRCNAIDTDPNHVHTATLRWT